MVENSSNNYTTEEIEEKTPLTAVQNESNEEQLIYTSANSKMSKTSKIVMFISLALSLIFLIWGIVTLNDGCGNKSGKLKISVGEGRIVNTEVYKNYTVTLEIVDYNSYTINIDGASLTSVKDEYNNSKLFSLTQDFLYDYSYSIQLNRGTYQLKLYASSEEVYIIVR